MTRDYGESSTLIDRSEEPRGSEVPVNKFEIDVQGIFEVLSNHKRWIAAVTGLFMMLGVLISYVLPAKYTATAKIMTPEQSTSAAILINQVAANASGALAGLAGGAGSLMRNPNDLYVALLKTRPIADEVIRKFNLMTVYHARTFGAARRKVESAVKIQSSSDGLIEISCTDHDKNLAAMIANNYPEQLRVVLKNLAASEAAQRQAFYEQELKQAKDALEEVETAFQQVQRRQGVIEPAAQAKALIERLAMLHSQITAKEVEVQSIRTYSTEQGPGLRIAENQLASLQAEARKLEQQQTKTAGFGDMTMPDVPGASVEFLAAEHEVRYRQAVFDLLIKQYDAARMDQAKDAAVIQVVEPAIVPEFKSSPNAILTTAAFTLLGLIAACATVVIRSNQRLWSRLNS